MRARPVIDVSGSSPYHNGLDAPMLWGMLGLIVIETMVVGSLISSYFFIRAQSPEWPPGGTSPPELLLPTINSLILIASSFVVHWADKSIKKGDKKKLAVGMLVAAIMAAVFLALKVVEYSDSEYKWDTHAYGSVVWALVGFHSAHVVALLLKTAIVDTLAFRRYFNDERRLGVTINGLYWHFVVVIWIPLYITIYLVPRI